MSISVFVTCWRELDTLHLMFFLCFLQIFGARRLHPSISDIHGFPSRSSTSSYPSLERRFGQSFILTSSASGARKKAYSLCTNFGSASPYPRSTSHQHVDLILSLRYFLGIFRYGCACRRDVDISALADIPAIFAYFWDFNFRSDFRTLLAN